MFSGLMPQWPWLTAVLVILIAAVVGYGIVKGDPAAYVIAVVLLAFVAVPMLVVFRSARRGHEHDR
jgi:hypothetical protein